jgi:NADH:ubiquinone oxidoreductase subunit H
MIGTSHGSFINNAIDDVKTPKFMSISAQQSGINSDVASHYHFPIFLIYSFAETNRTPFG